MLLYLLSRRVIRRLFRAPAEYHPAFVEMESSECDSADDTDAEQLATAQCTSAQQSGGGSAPATAKADHLAADHLWKKRCRAEETTRVCCTAAELPFLSA